LNVIENIINSKKIQDYEIFLVDHTAFESIILKDKVDNNREIYNFEYTLRILSQKNNETGVGIVQGNSLDPKEIENNIDTCNRIANTNLSTKYHFPDKSSPKKVATSDKNVINDPLKMKEDLVEELLSEIKEKKEVKPTFGRFRVHLDKIFLRNSNSVDLHTFKTYFFIEFSLKAQQNTKLSEYWPFLIVKEKNQLDFSNRVEKWAQLAQDSLIAQIPYAEKKATIVFSPQVLHNAFNPVISAHASGMAYHQKISRFQIDKEVASASFSIIDDGLMEGGLATNGWDGEGTPHQRNEIITDGIFKNRLYDQKYALLENTSSTGNGNRAHDGSIINGITNLEIKAGDMDFNEMISQINYGYFIEQFSWLMPSQITGTFGAEIRAGYYIKDGKISHPIKLGNVSGNVFEMIKNCLYVTKKREYFSNCLFPYMTFANLTVSS
jgi:predicted Zn-dependent protease